LPFCARAATGEHRAKVREHGIRMIEMKDINDNLSLEFSNPLYIFSNWSI
jgi:hypothetical protein